MIICYFGIYNPIESRNKIYMKGLRQNGVTIIECRDTTRGPLKYLKLFWKHFKIRNAYDFLIVGYPGHVVVPFAKFISKKPVILDALCSLYEGVIISREKHGAFFLREKYTRLVDRLAIRYADIILLETNLQKKFFEENLNAPAHKCVRLFTGADDEVFHLDSNIKKRENFTVVFRGKFLPEAGVPHIITAAKILENSGIDFLIIGNGFLKRDIVTLFEEVKPANMTLILHNLDFQELKTKMQECHVSLGQFGRHKRLSRTIPHKCFESLALGLPYVTARAEGVAEILRDKENCLFVHAGDSEDLAEKIRLLRDDHVLRENIARNGHALYLKECTPFALAKELLSIIMKTYPYETHTN